MLKITTNSGLKFTYLPSTNEICEGDMSFDASKASLWKFKPPMKFSTFPDVLIFIIGLTEQCNLRCRYCCYSGSYENNRSHGSKKLVNDDIDKIIDFIAKNCGDSPQRISFYGGEPLSNLKVLEYGAALIKEKWGEKVDVSVSTNGLLLNREVIDWGVKNNIEFAISIDGGKFFHDLNRVDAEGRGSYGKVIKNLENLLQTNPKCRFTLHTTLFDIRDIAQIAEEWHKDSVLKNLRPAAIHGLSPNFSLGVKRLEYEEVKAFYSGLIDIYQAHRDWRLLETFLLNMVDDWKNRMIFEAPDEVPLSTCIPFNTKLYIDSNLDIAVCEKIADRYRIGNIESGIDWTAANMLAQDYFEKMSRRCENCDIFRMCDLCLSSTEFSEEQMNLLCHNSRIYAKVSLFVFCEMALRGLVE